MSISNSTLRVWLLPMAVVLLLSSTATAQSNMTVVDITVNEAAVNGSTVGGNVTLGVNETMAPSFAPSSAPSMYPTMAPTWLGNIPPECANETAALDRDQNLTNTLNELLAEYKQQFDTACPFTLTNTGCDLTYGGETAYHALCFEKGGQIFEHSVILQCGVDGLNSDTNLGVVPECFGASCNLTTADISMLRSPVIVDFAESLDNGGCGGKIQSGSYSKYSSLLGMVGSIGIAFWSALS